jgi:hypothetical protein
MSLADRFFQRASKRCGEPLKQVVFCSSTPAISLAVSSRPGHNAARHPPTDLIANT